MQYWIVLAYILEHLQSPFPSPHCPASLRSGPEILLGRPCFRFLPMGTVFASSGQSTYPRTMAMPSVCLVCVGLSGGPVLTLWESSASSSITALLIPHPERPVRWTFAAAVSCSVFPFPLDIVAEGSASSSSKCLHPGCVSHPSWNRSAPHRWSKSSNH